MILRILKKDLKRKKGMNLILLLFVILVTVFTAAGINNTLTVLNGVEHFMDVSGFSDMVALSLGGDVTEDELKQTLDEIPEIKSCKIEKTYMVSGVETENGDEKFSSIASEIQSLSMCKIKLFNNENKEVSAPDEGGIKLAYSLYEEWGLEEGSTVTVKLAGKSYEFRVDGWFKDVVFGSPFMGIDRFLLNQRDMEMILNDGEIADKPGYCVFIETDDSREVQARIIEKLPNMTTVTRSTLEMCFIMDILIALVVLIASVCLMAVSFIILRFSIGLTVSEEYHEIGVMKAIGIPDRRIRLIYLIKYAGIAILGCFAGFFISFPMTELMLSSATKNMVLESENPVLLSLISACLVAVMIVVFAWSGTAKVKKATPIDAIRNGQTGERFKKKSLMHLGKSCRDSASFLALNDIFSSPKRFLTVLISFSLCTLIVLVLVITCDTLDGDGIINLITAEHDIYSGYFGENGLDELIVSGNNFKTYIDDTQKELDTLGFPAKVTCDIMFSFPYSYDGVRQNSYFLYGLGCKVSDYQYRRGTAPQNAGEVAITEVKAKEIGADIGDTITVHFSSGDKNYIISGTFDILINLGNCLRFHEDETAVLNEPCYGCLAAGMDFTDNPDGETVEARKKQLREHWDTEDVYSAAELIGSQIGSVIEPLSSVRDLLLMITFAVIILVTLLMEKAFISNEKSQIAILKAVGFRNGRIILWHSLRFIFVSAVSAILAAVLSLPLTKLCITPVFAMMGASGVRFTVDGISIFIIYPLIILAATCTVAFLASLGTGSITARDTASNE